MTADNITEKYTALVEAHGLSYKSLDWGSRNAQQKRFEVIHQVGIGDGDSVLDVGCGLCDLYEYFLQGHVGVDYSGIDITEAMIAASRQRFPDVNARHMSLSDLPETESHDYVVSSGIFYLLDKEEDAHRLIDQMFARAGKGIVFNSLSSWCQGDPGELLLDPCKTLNYCRGLSSRVVLRADYLPNDFSIYVLKGST